MLMFALLSEALCLWQRLKSTYQNMCLILCWCSTSVGTIDFVSVRTNLLLNHDSLVWSIFCCIPANYNIAWCSHWRYISSLGNVVNPTVSMWSFSTFLGTLSSCLLIVRCPNLTCSDVHSLLFVPLNMLWHVLGNIDIVTYLLSSAPRSHDRTVGCSFAYVNVEYRRTEHFIVCTPALI